MLIEMGAKLSDSWVRPNSSLIAPMSNSIGPLAAVTLAGSYFFLFFMLGSGFAFAVMPLVAAASRLKLLGWVSIGLIFTAMAAMITLAANAALAANAQVIEVLRLVGARDAYIAQAFVRRFTLRALAGAAAGTVAGLVAVALLPAALR